MARPSEQTIVASLFDRLTDYEPRNSREVAPPQWEQLENYKRSVARDLTHLLNTRRSDHDIGEEFEAARESVLAYGVEDFTTAPMDREDIRRSVERAVRLFEPRLSRVQVSFEEGRDFSFSYRISALLRAQAGVEPVIYDAEMPKESRRFQVTAGR